MLKDHLAYCQRSLKDQSRFLKDWPRPLKELWKTDQDPRENSERLTETAARILKERDNRDCRKIMERLIRPLKVHWETAERLLKDHWKTIFLKDRWKTVLNRFKKFWRPRRPRRPLKDQSGIVKDLGDHWKFIERPLKDQASFMVFQRSFSGLALCGMAPNGLLSNYTYGIIL